MKTFEVRVLSESREAIQKIVDTDSLIDWMIEHVRATGQAVKCESERLSCQKVRGDIVLTIWSQWGTPAERIICE